jgi:hypothetical protein
MTLDSTIESGLGVPLYIVFCYNAHGCICIENAPTLILIDFCSVATRPALVAIGSHRVATRSGRVAIVSNPIGSCNGSKLLQLVPSSCN